MSQWLVFLVVAVLYVHLFNALATLYFESERKLTWRDLYRRFVPPAEFTLRV